MKTKYLKNVILAFGILFLLGIGYSFVEKSDDQNANDPEKSFEKNYNVFSLDLPQSMNFAGESVPINQPDIFERMDRELLVNTYWQSNGILMIKRSKKYFPIIEPILKANGVPDDFKYLAVAESGLTDVVSPAGATGFWQIMKYTGTDFGMEINSNVDERYNIEKSTQVACNYLKKAKEKFGSWSMAAASYNVGMAGLEKQMERQQETGYYNLLLNDETERYVFRILAIKEVLSKPQKYSFNINEEHLYKRIKTKTVKVDSAITDIPAFAKGYGLNYKQLKIHNPWMRDNFLLNKSGKVYQIKIPLKGEY